MKRYLRFIIPLLIVALAVGFAITRTNQTTATRQKMPKPPSYPFDEARKIAEENLPKFMRSMAQQYERYGLKDAEEAQRAMLGVPYIGYSFDFLELANGDLLEGALRSHLDGGTDILFPVLIDDQVHAVMSVAYRKGQWQDGVWSSYAPTMIVALQERLIAKGITEHVDQVNFGTVQTIFGMIDYKGQTMLIPLQDEGKYFPELDFSGDRMYTLDEVLPLVRVQAQRAVEDIERQNREMLLRMPTQGPSPIPGPTATPVPVYPAPVLEPTAIAVP